MSCSRSDLQTPAPGEPNALRVEVSLNAEALSNLGNGFVPTRAAGESGLAVNIGGADRTAEMTKSTTELSTADDAKVHNLWAIQYKADGTLLGSPYYTTDIPTPGAGSTGVDATYSLAVNLTSNTETDGKVYFIANTNSPNTFNATNAATESKLKEVVKNIGTELKPTAEGGIPMVGIYTGAVQSSATLSAVPMKRLAAKVILRYKVDPSFAGFTITGIQMRNVAADMHLGAEPTGIFPAAADDSHIDYPAEDLTKATTDGDYKKFVWYVPENHRDVISSVLGEGDRALDRTDGKATYIEIHGRQTTTAQSKKITYRILLGDPSTAPGDFNVRRNTTYQVEVNINGANAGDNRITVESFDMNNCAILWPGATAGSVTFDVRKCLANKFTTESQLNTMLSSGAWRVEVLWQDVAVNNYVTVAYNEPGQTDDKALGLFTVTATTKTPGNAVVALYDNASSGGTILWSWHIWVTGYLPDGTKDYGLGINSKAAVDGGEVHTYGEGYKKALDRMGGGPLRVIMDRNLGATQAYNTGVPAANDPNAIKAYGLLYQWGRKDPFPRINSAEGTNDDDITSFQPIYQGTTVLTPGTSNDESANGYKRVSRSIAGENPPATLYYSMKNPLTFICSKVNLESDSYDWYAKEPSLQNDVLWGDGAVKSDYDPCPKGWRVPVHGIWDDFGTDGYSDPFFMYINGVKQTADGTPAYTRHATNGRLYAPVDGTVKSWYPMGGAMRYSTGLCYNTGRNGYLWTSTPIRPENIVNNYNYYFDTFLNGVNPHASHYRAQGFNVRCMQE